MSQKEALVLIGSTHVGYVSSLLDFVKKRKAVWTAWDFRVRSEWRKAILDRLKSQGKFPMFFYLSKKKGGTGKVGFVGVFDDVRISDVPIKSPDLSLTTEDEREFPTDDFPSYTWFRFYEIATFGPIDLSYFMDIDTEDPIVPSQLRSAFAYAYLPEDFAEKIEEKEYMPEIGVSVEKDLRRYLVMDLESLEPGLQLFSGNGGTGEEYSTDVGRIDILAVDKDKNLVVIELKAGDANSSAYGQISAYMGWVQQKLAKGKKVRGIIVANNFDDKLKYAVALHPDISLKKYELRFEFKGITPLR